MNRLSYIFADGSNIEIELIDNDFINEWLQYFLHEVVDYKSIIYKIVTLDGSDRQIDKTQIDQDLDLIEHSLIYLSNNFSLNFEEARNKTIEEKLKSPMISQHYCNYIHRIFTRLMNNQNVTGLLPIFSDSDLFLNIHNLNDAVHRLETMSAFKMSGRRAMFYNKPLIHLGIPGYSFKEKKWLKKNFDPLIEPYDYTVWLNEDILGKDMIRSWLDHDTIRFDDITGNLFYTPSLILDPYKTIKSVIDNPDWKTYYSETYKTLNRFPIGNMVNRDIKQFNSKTSPISSIVLNNKVIF